MPNRLLAPPVRALSWREIIRSPRSIEVTLVPSELRGSLNDFQGKAVHQGRVDQESVSLAVGVRGEAFYHLRNGVSCFRHRSKFDAGCRSLFDGPGETAELCYHDRRVLQLSARLAVRNRPVLAKLFERWSSVNSPEGRVTAELAYGVLRLGGVVDPKPFGLIHCPHRSAQRSA